jgi:serine/threonine protein kinase
MQEKTSQTKLEDFQKIKYLGRGSFGEVHLVKNIQNQQLLAMKEIDKR